MRIKLKFPVWSKVLLAAILVSSPLYALERGYFSEDTANLIIGKTEWQLGHEFFQDMEHTFETEDDAKAFCENRGFEMATAADFVQLQVYLRLTEISNDGYSEIRNFLRNHNFWLSPADEEWGYQTLLSKMTIYSYKNQSQDEEPIRALCVSRRDRAAVVENEPSCFSCLWRCCFGDGGPTVDLPLDSQKKIESLDGFFVGERKNKRVSFQSEQKGSESEQKDNAFEDEDILALLYSDRYNKSGVDAFRESYDPLLSSYSSCDYVNYDSSDCELSFSS